MAQLLEYIKMAFFNILSNKMRSLLTMLGIIIGISSVILILSLGNGAKDMINNQLSALGGGQVSLMSIGSEWITDDDIEAVIENIDGVIAYLNPINLSGEAYTARGTFSAYVYGCNADNYLFEQYTEILKGRYFNEQEYESAAPVCYITDEDAIRLFGNTDVIGMPIEVMVNGAAMEYTIVGITSYSSNTSMLSFAYEDMPIYLNVPITSLEQRFGINMNQTSNVTLMLSEDVDSKETCDAVINLLNARHGTYGSEAFTFMSFSDILSTITLVINMITLFISLVAAISLLVGGIGVMNIMLVSVTERTREIGIRKALGAKTGSITLQFLSESAIITMIGGILGILIGIGGAFLITGIVGAVQPNYAFTPSINAGVIIGTTIFSSAVGIFFGIYPARKAAKMHPIDALRSL